LTGAAQCNRFLTQVAIDSLGHLYFDSKNKKISQKIYSVWMVHEIADVRAHCLSVIYAIGEPIICPFMKQMNDLDSLSDISTSKAYFEQQMLNVDTLTFDSWTKICAQLTGGLDARLMSLIAACCAVSSPGSQPSPVEVKTFLRTIDQNILRDPLESHLVKELALEVVARIAKTAGASLAIEDRNFVWDLSLTQLRTSVFKQVRLGGKKALQASEYPHSKVFDCFGGVATGWFKVNGFNFMSRFLEETLPKAQREKVEARLQVMERPADDIAAMFTTSNSTGAVAFEPEEDPVILLYVYLAMGNTLGVNTLFIQERLNSLDYFARYVGLVCIGALLDERKIKVMRKEVCPGFVQTELISDVRDLALVVLDDRAGAPKDASGCCSSCCSCCASNDLDDPIQEMQSRRAALSKKELEQLEDRTKNFKK
jgi:hypothetical protein